MAELAAPRYFDSVEISELRAALLAQPRSFWDLDAHIKRAQAPGRDGNMVWIWKTSWVDGTPTTRAGSAIALARLVTPIISKILENYPKGGEVINALFPLLPAGGVIPPHQDRGPLLTISHRIHVPLILNPDVEFLVDGKRVALNEGVPFELPNQQQHSVRNRGAEDRIHLLFDYLPGEPKDVGELAWLPQVVKGTLD